MNRFRRSSWHALSSALVLLATCCTLMCQQAIAFQEKSDSTKAKDTGKATAATKTPAETDTAATAKPVQPMTAIVGATVITMGSAGTLQNATILIEGQKIKAVGVDVEVPKDATTINADGMTITPGLIDCRSSLWLARDSVSASASNGGLNALDAVDPFSDSWQEVASQGITSVCVGPKGSLGGQSVILRVAPATSTAQLLIKAESSMQASLGLSGSTGNSKDRYAQYEAIKKTLTSAKTYKESWDKYREAKKKADKAKAAKSKATAAKSASKKPEPKTKTSDPKKPNGEKTEEKKTESPKKPKKDAIKDVLVRVLNKELPLRIEAHRADDIANAMQLAKDFDLTVTFEGVSDAGRTWKTLGEQHPALVVGPFSDFESTPSYASSEENRYDALAHYDGLMAIATFSKDSRASRLLRYHAAAAVGRGVDPETALKAITIDAARILDIDDQVGSIESGKLADLVVVASNPINPAAAVMLTMSHGSIVFQNNDVKPTKSASFTDSSTPNFELPTKFALVSDRILYPNGKFAPGVVLVQAGKIMAVRKAKSKTGDYPVIDVGSAIITPGLVVAHYAETAVRTSDAVASQIRAIDALQPSSTRLRDLSKHGFTTVMYSPDSQSVVAGQIGCVRFLSEQQIVTQKSQPVLPASKFVLSGSSRSNNRFPASLSGQLSLIRQYMAGTTIASNLYLPNAAMKLLEERQIQLLEALKNRSQVAVIEASSAAEISAAAKVAEEFGLATLVLHPDDPTDSLSKLKELKAGIIVRTARVSDRDWYANDIAAAANSGVKISVSGNDATRIRQTLAAFVNAGMNEAAALKAITTDAAASYGLKNVGSLTRGSFADIVIWDESPLNLSARPIHVIVDGRLTKDLK
ncbi:MAG: amidohydrolase family protein [Fuerstiella sp.]